MMMMMWWWWVEITTSVLDFPLGVHKTGLVSLDICRGFDSHLGVVVVVIVNVAAFALLLLYSRFHCWATS